MKLRADFVTNSSSSSYISFTFVMKDGTEIMSGNIPALEYYSENYYENSQEELLQKFQNMQTLDELLDFLELSHAAFNSNDRKRAMSDVACIIAEKREMLWDEFVNPEDEVFWAMLVKDYEEWLKYQEEEAKKFGEEYTPPTEIDWGEVRKEYNPCLIIDENTFDLESKSVESRKHIEQLLL